MSEAPAPSFRDRVTSAFGAAATILVVDALMRLGLLAVLARRLTPVEFGIATAGVLVLSILSALSSLGLSAVLIQTPELSARRIAVARTLLLCSSVALFLLVLLCAPLVGGWFRDGRVTEIVRLLSVTCLANAAGLIPQTLLRRDLRTRDLGLIELGSAFLGTALVATPMAFLGFGYWSLVVGALVQALARAILLCLVVRLPPTLGLDRREAGALLFSGAGFSLNALFLTIGLQSDRLIVGRFMSAADLGFYARAVSLMSFTVDVFGSLADRVVFPAFATLQAERERLRAAHGQVISLMTLVSLPAAVFLIAMAPEVVAVVLGPRWGTVVEPFRILCLSLPLRLADRFTGALIRGKGRSYLAAGVQAAGAAAMILACLFARGHGVSGMAAAVVLAALLTYVLSSIAAARLTGLTPGAFVSAHAQGVATALLAAAVLGPVLWVSDHQTLGAAAALTLAVGACAAAGLLAAWLAPSLFLGDAGIAALRSVMAVAGRSR